MIQFGYFLTVSSILFQTVDINLEAGIHDKHPSQQDGSYHFAVSGRAFAVIVEHFPQLVQKVNQLVKQLLNRAVY